MRNFNAQLKNIEGFIKLQYLARKTASACRNRIPFFVTQQRYFEFSASTNYFDIIEKVEKTKNRISFNFRGNRLQEFRCTKHQNERKLQGNFILLIEGAHSSTYLNVEQLKNEAPLENCIFRQSNFFFCFVLVFLALEKSSAIVLAFCAV